MFRRPRPDSARGRRLRVAAGVLGAALTVGVAACGGGGGTATEDAPVDTIAPSITLLPSDPAPSPPGSIVVTHPATAPIATAPAEVTIPATTPVTAPAETTVPVDTTAATTTLPAETAPLGLAVLGTVPPLPAGGIPTDAGAPAVDAAAYAVYDATGGRWLAGREAETPRAVGSVMKLLTAYVVMAAGDPGHVVTVPALGLDPAESSIWLYQGEQLPRDLLVRAMLIVSANDAAKALAIDLAGSEEAFAAQMTTAAGALGLTGTVAANARGLDAEGAHSTAADMTRLAALLLQDETFRTTVARTDARLHGTVFPATNKLLGAYPGAIGVKTGRTTQAGYCLVAAATRDGRTIIATVLGAPTEAARLQAATALLDWGFAQPAS